jgi:hypothetical protein
MKLATFNPLAIFPLNGFVTVTTVVIDILNVTKLVLVKTKLNTLLHLSL